MKNRNFLSIGIIGFGLVASVFIVAGGARAETLSKGGGILTEIRYPITELGNCANESDCRTYCDSPTNSAACLSFAQKNNLMTSEEIQLAKNFEKLGSKGPGGCTVKDRCETYCNDITHINECVTFAEQNNLMSKDQLVEAKKIQTAIAKGIKPPACKNKSDCDKYCSETAHMEECIMFGQAAGLMSERDLVDSQKMLTALKKGIKPPACNGKDECDKYCRDVAHAEECITFAKAAGFMTPEEEQNSDKMLTALKKGIKPPACNGKDECDKYCNDSAHVDECIAFSEAAGFMTPEGAAMARKTGGKGPGGCMGREQCDVFCNNPDNQETCFNFGRDNGMIPQDQFRQMEEGKKQLTDSLGQASTKVIDCLSGVVGADRLEKIKSGTLMPTRDIGDKIGECFRENMGNGPSGPGEGWIIQPGDGSTNFKEQFNPGSGGVNPGGQTMPQQAGPGGCKTPEECKLFCVSNPDVCRNFRPSGTGGQTMGIEGQPVQNMVVPQLCEGKNCMQLFSGTQLPGQIPMPGNIQNIIEDAAVIMQRIQPGAQMQGQIPTCAPGTQCGPETFIQIQPGSMLPQVEMAPPVNNFVPTTLLGGSFFNAVKSFFDF